VQELQVLLHRRDTHIRHLYQRELDYSRIIHSRSVRLAQCLAAPFRWLFK
jgi:hypothetical protein